MTQPDRPSCPDPIECSHEAALGEAEAKLESVHATATAWARPSMSEPSRIAGQHLLRLLDGEPRAVPAGQAPATDQVEPEPEDPPQCSGDEGFCPEHGFHRHSLKQPGTTEPDTGHTALRDRIAGALLDHLSRTADIRRDTDGELAFMPVVTDEERMRITDAIAAVLPASVDRAAAGFVLWLDASDGSVPTHDGIRWPDGTATIRHRHFGQTTTHPDPDAAARAAHGKQGRIVWPEPASVDRAAALADAERTMLTYALDQAQERIWSEDGFTDEDQAAVTSLRRLAAASAVVVRRATDETPGEAHAPGTAVLCPDCRAKGHAVCMSGEGASEVVHGCPPDGSGLTPCCGRTPFELPRTDRISSEAPVTCPGPAVGAQQPICKCPAEICQCGHHQTQQPKEA